jgi:Rha family phage regulatory protein
MKALAPSAAPVQVELVDGHPTTTSLDIAAHFGKRHADVIRAITKLDCSPEFNARNFALVEYVDAKGENRPQYRLTRDGFTFLCMGFTGKEAARWKEAYISAFNQMEAMLKHGRFDGNEDQTIGSEGFQTLQRLIKGKVASLPATERRRATSRLWGQIHAAFGVSSAFEIPAGLIDNACVFIGSYAIEGEFLPKTESQCSAMLSDQDCHDAFHLLHHLRFVGRDLPGLIRLQESSQSPWMGRTLEHLRVALMKARDLEARNPLIEQRYRALVRN